MTRVRAASTIIPEIQKLVRELSSNPYLQPWEEASYESDLEDLSKELYTSVMGIYHAKIKFPAHMKEDIIQTILKISVKLDSAQ